MALSLITPDSLNLAQDYAGMGFGGTGSANQLDDYEEGTWTPVITFGGNSAGQTYSSQNGRYVKIGTTVSTSCYVRFTNKGTSTGYALITGLPYASRNQTAFYHSLSVWHNNMSIGTDYNLTPYQSPNTNNIVLWAKRGQDASGVQLSDSVFLNNTDLMITYTYITD